MPELWPHTYYNTRYGILAVAWASFAAGAIVTAVSRRWRKFAIALPLLALTPWLLHPSRENVICWKESQVNSVARRAWTQSAAGFLRSHYEPGQGIIASFGDPIGILCYARIPIRDSLHIGNGPEWLATASRPDLIHTELWAIAQAGDALSKDLRENRKSPYRIVQSIDVPGAALLIFKREDE